MEEISKETLDLLQQIQEAVADLKEDFNEMKDTMNAGFDSFNERFDRLDEKISDTKSELCQEIQKINDALDRNEEVMKRLSKRQ